LPTTLAGRVILLAYVGSLVLFLSFISRHVSRVPFNDEYSTFRFLFGEAGTRPTEYWVQHNEHRIPLPQAVYVGTVWLSGYDFRAPVVVNAALLALVAGYLLWVVRRVRGRFSVADAFLPLTVLGLGGWENLIWGFQLQFVLSTVLLLGFLGLVLIPGFPASVRRVGAAGFVVVLLPLCGANGVALVPALAVGLLFVGVRNLRSADRSLRRPGLVAILGGLAGLALLTAYFHGLQKVDYHPPPPNLESVAYAAVNFLGLGMGPVTHLMHSPGYDRITVLGGAVVVLVAATGVILVRSLRESEERPRAVAVGCVLGGLLCLAGGLAYGRAGFGNIMGASRYVTLAMPIPVTAYLAWIAFGRGLAGRGVPFVLLLAILAFLVPNTRFAYLAAGEHAARLKKVEREIRDGVPIGFITDGNRSVYPGSPAGFRTSLGLLRDHGVRPFAAIRPDPPLAAESVPVRVLRTEGVVEDAGGFRVSGGIGTVVLALPGPTYAYGVALTYEVVQPAGRVQALVSWDRGGRTPPAAGCGALDQLVATGGPTTTRVFTDREIDVVRIDLVGPGTVLRVHRLTILTRTD
jgi:hypothetical protein